MKGQYKGSALKKFSQAQYWDFQKELQWKEGLKRALMT